jgi:hypothetical protein
MRACSKSVDLKLKRETKFKVINEQHYRNIIRQNGFGETNIFASASLILGRGSF